MRSIPQHAAAALARRLAERSVTTPAGCIELVKPQKRRYTSISFQGENYMAHRAMYVHHRGPIPAGLTLDHLCRNTKCFNPQHLEAVTQAVNVRRGEAPAAINARKTACPEGHEYDRLANGRRFCPTCRAAGLKADDDRHGTQGGYFNWGCRCSECKAAARERYTGGLPDGDPRHGTLNGYNNLGCRCPSCKAARRNWRATGAAL